MEPGLFKGAVARNKRDVHGLVAGGGFRFAGGGDGRVEWRAEISVNAEPGQVKSVEYIVDEPGLFGAKSAHAATRVGYGIFPEAKAGISF